MGVSKTQKTYSSRYKTDVSVSQTSNVGFDSTTRTLCSGDGADSSMSASDDVFQVKPVNDNGNTMLVKNKGGSNILAVDTTNSKVLVGASQVAANTQYAYFQLNSGTGYLLSADTHFALGTSNASIGSSQSHSMGSATSSTFNDTDPATSLTHSTYAGTWLKTYWYVPDNITVDAVHWLHAADAATGDSTAAHLMRYDLDVDNSSTGGDLSGGVVVADGATITNAGYEQIYYQSMTIQSADVNAGQVIFFTFASDTINSDYDISATVKYHIR